MQAIDEAAQVVLHPLQSFDALVDVARQAIADLVVTWLRRKIGKLDRFRHPGRESANEDQKRVRFEVLQPETGFEAGAVVGVRHRRGPILVRFMGNRFMGNMVSPYPMSGRPNIGRAPQRPVPSGQTEVAQQAGDLEHPVDGGRRLPNLEPLPAPGRRLAHPQQLADPGRVDEGQPREIDHQRLDFIGAIEDVGTEGGTVVGIHLAPDGGDDAVVFSSDQNIHGLFPTPASNWKYA